MIECRSLNKMHSYKYFYYNYVENLININRKYIRLSNENKYIQYKIFPLLCKHILIVNIFRYI